MVTGALRGNNLSLRRPPVALPPRNMKTTVVWRPGQEIVSRGEPSPQPNTINLVNGLATEHVLGDQLRGQGEPHIPHIHVFTRGGSVLCTCIREQGHQRVHAR
ncbi:unnamed protein product [Ectocarpus sp. 8 AP-2014]